MTTKPLTPREEAMVRTRAEMRVEDDLMRPPPFVRWAFDDRHRLLATLDAARKASPPLDVERLAQAILRHSINGGMDNIPPHRWDLYAGTIAKELAREYAALDPTP